MLASGISVCYKFQVERGFFTYRIDFLLIAGNSSYYDMITNSFLLKMWGTGQKGYENFPFFQSF